MTTVPKATRIRLLGGLLLAWMVRAPLATGQGPEKLDEYAVKAAYLYHFSRYVEWPANEPAGTFIVGVLGDHPPRDALSSLEGRKAKRGTIAVRFFSAVDKIEPCHILFIPGRDDAARELLPGALERIGSRPVLVVTEADGGAEQGASINFVMVNSNIRFEINRDAAGRAGLTLSAKLLRLATRTISNSAQGE